MYILVEIIHTEFQYISLIEIEKKDLLSRLVVVVSQPGQIKLSVVVVFYSIAHNNVVCPC